MFHFYVVRVAFISFVFTVEKIVPFSIPKILNSMDYFPNGLHNLNHWSIWNVFYVKTRIQYFSSV